MKTLLMTNQDLALSNHSFVTLDNKNTLRQRVVHRLALFLGEFSLEPNLGLDWFGFQTSSDEEIKKAIAKELLKDNEITSIISIDVLRIDTFEKAKQYNKPIRTILVNCRLNTIYGEIRI